MHELILQLKKGKTITTKPNKRDFLTGWSVCDLIIPCRKCALPYLETAAAAPRAVPHSSTSVCRVLLSKQWYGCQQLGILMCAVCIESWVKLSLLHREWHSYQYCAKTFSPMLYLTATKQKCIKCHQTETQCTTNAQKFSRKDPQKKERKTRQSKQQNQVEKQGKR